MKRALLALMLMLWLGVNAVAQEYVNDEFHFALSLPADQGWAPPDVKTAASGTLTKPQLLQLVAGRSDRGISIVGFDSGDGVSLDAQEYREGLRAGAVKSFPQTMRLMSEKRATFAGVPAYELLFFGTIQNLPVHIRLVAIVANHHQYTVTGHARDAASLIDGDVAQVLSSFRFTQPPQVPNATLTPRDLGALAGRFTAYAAMVCVAGLIVALVVKRRKRPGRV